MEISEKEKSELEQAIQESITDIVGSNEIWFNYDQIENDTVLIHIGIKKVDNGITVKQA